MYSLMLVEILSSVIPRNEFFVIKFNFEIFFGFSLNLIV